MTIDTAIKQAKQILMEYWPLSSFIATNPLWEMRDTAFFDVVSTPWLNGLMTPEYYYKQYNAKKITDHDLQQAITLIEKRSFSNTELEQWINSAATLQSTQQPKVLFAEQIEEHRFQQPTAWIQERIFTVLRDYFGRKAYEHTDLLHFWWQQNPLKATDLDALHLAPPEQSIMLLTKKLNIPEETLAHYLQNIYCKVYGWASLMNWRNQHSNNPWIPGNDPCEVVLLMWLFYEYTIAAETKQTYSNALTEITSQHENFNIRYIWQTALELHYLNELENTLNEEIQQTDKTPDAQFIFCIDTRSEGLRRHIEAQGPYQTFSFAGFFGAIFSLNDNGNITYQAPALVEPSQLLKVKTHENLFSRLAKITSKITKQTKKQFTAPFAFFELFGFWLFFLMLFKTFKPRLKTKNHSDDISIDNTLSEEQQYQAASTLLNSIGLVDTFADWVLICAHQSDNLNNPFKSSLNCGACGGNSGIPNAVVMSMILNKKEIRLKLKENGIDIPSETQFIPACHHTVNDRLTAIKGDIPASLQQVIALAANALRAEKTTTLPGRHPLSQREESWSELIPELGLINNTSFIIAPRGLTLNQNLHRRAFLHSYEPHLDKEGKILTSILSAPAIVTHWISSQYYFSTTNPELFGAGNKAIHNVLPGIGVLEGNLSDLKVGLPLQSTHFQAIPIHEPRRIIIIVYAHKATLDTAIQHSPEFKKLLDNQWIYLKHIEPK